MSKLFISVRITENFFTNAEIKAIHQELQAHKNKSEFLRKAIKSYLSLELKDQAEEKPNKYSQELAEIKKLLKENQSILKGLEQGNFNPSSGIKVYEGQEQELKTEQALGLLKQF